ncbi:DEAD/DEAH box helicase family protein [Butyrivibrio sp. VCB2001]|uniref:DEAD/DEAH box helicase family protein n=1 Tax=Butyrivibrio sp. VCB2001 TaxID=1280667 RepID=UPI00040FA005|nr:DEAD/DEAH box helicase family protein [Butyrivibrio sp. VCB2001]
MAFKIKKKEEFVYNTPQEMYQDNKLKKIMGPLDYQSAMLDAYIKQKDSKNIALELPTGSGKTLVGLLIAEYRRRKNKEKVLFLCPTNQLVHQVEEQAKDKYGINVISFCGKQKEYKPSDKSKFLLAEAVGVTTYSAFFATNTFFSDVDVVIMDDVHSCEDYIISNWTVKIQAGTVLFSQLSSLLRPYISDNDYNNLIEEDYSPELALWCNMVPVPIIYEQLGNINAILQAGIEPSSSNYYAFSRIAENIQDCNFIIANQCILLRPWIAPTMTHRPFAGLKQRVLMSATLGKNGELERITGLEKITRLPIVNDWDKKGLGRRFFVFPNLSLKDELMGEVVEKLQSLCKKSVFLVPDNVHAEEVKEYYEENLKDSKVFVAGDIELSKNGFVNSADATVILANRFDGIDFANDESRLLFIWNLPKTTNIQEKFLIYRMGSSKLYEERIRTRIIQAVGRCSRNPSDYSIVCILGDTVQNDLTKIDNLKKYAPELRAEIQFGLENSSDYEKVEEIVEQARDFLERNATWQEADEYIVDLRNGYWNDKDSSTQLVNEKLHNAAVDEVKFQYYLWKKAYKEAFEEATKVVDHLNVPSLGGYKAYWQYISGCIAYYLMAEGEREYIAKGYNNIKDAQKATIGIKWLPNLAQKFNLDNESSEIDEDFFGDIVCNLENVFTQISSSQKLEKKIKAILDDLNSPDGLKFERGFKELGNILGYVSINPETSGAPDPYWIINRDLAIVSEDKIYDEKENVKNIPINDVREAVSHKIWMRENASGVSDNAEIISIFVTNSKEIDSEARIYADDLFYVLRDDFVKWALNATTVIRTIYSSFSNQGNQDWRDSAHRLFVENEITPKAYMRFIGQKKLKDL